MKNFIIIIKEGFLILWKNKEVVVELLQWFLMLSKK